MKTKVLILLSAIMLIISGPAFAAETAESPSKKGPDIRSGKVLETQTAGKYTYIRLDEDGEELWLATQPAYLKSTINEGDSVEYIGGVEMPNFESKALNKTFDAIRLVTKVRVLKDGVPIDTHSMPDDDNHKSVRAKQGNVGAPSKEEITRPEGGKTIGEIFSQKESLKDSEISFSGKVMKVNKNILGNNWITIQDGTGTPPDNKLIATTKDLANPGDMVTVTGIVKTDIDLGSGYKYKLIIENASLIK